MKKRDKIIMGTVLGGAIGSVLGFMFAPKKGKEMRQDIKEFYDEHEDTIKKVQKKAKNLSLSAARAIRDKLEKND
ncbi:MAG: YtxH domain-containing protein [Candidatus Gracilibacteria bacterium]|nr:YtxH domain-containing protein [Candidatus Gracilibacteria bacterium]